MSENKEQAKTVRVRVARFEPYADFETGEEGLYLNERGSLYRVDDVDPLLQELAELRGIAFDLCAWFAALPLNEKLRDHDALLQVVRRARDLPLPSAPTVEAEIAEGGGDGR